MLIVRCGDCDAARGVKKVEMCLSMGVCVCVGVGVGVGVEKRHACGVDGDDGDGQQLVIDCKEQTALNRPVQLWFTIASQQGCHRLNYVNCDY